MTAPAPVLLDPDQIDELRRLLGTVEDWLLHACEETLDDLGEFLAGLSWSTTTPARLTAALIADLGEHTILLRQALARQALARQALARQALARQALARPRPDGAPS